MRITRPRIRHGIFGYISCARIELADVRLEIRGEAFNLINGVRPLTPLAGSTTLNINSPNTFGVILSSYDPRIMQFAMKFVF